MNWTENNPKGSAFALFNAMQKDNLGHIYRGRFTQKITDSILSLTETNLDKEEESPKIKKRVYAIMVECLQNITRHQDDAEDNDPKNFGIFVIQKQEAKYFITTGNLVEKKNIDQIKSLIEKINSLEKEELKDYYKKVLIEGSLSDKGGAGLGLIDMARKSGNKLIYNFKDISDIYSYFYLHTIPSLTGDFTEQGSGDSLENIMEIHQFLSTENILLVFNGVFNQDSLLNLLATVQGQMKGSESHKKKVFNIIVEMLQNIVKHGVAKTSIDYGNPGIFFISESKNSFNITTGNFILNDHIKKLENKLKKINLLNKKELENYYNELLLNFEHESNKKTGLGLIDMCIKSKNKLIYSFNQIDDIYSFFSLQTSIIIK
ncbi:MAG: SiaB family protein kinase [Bacteroidota bacterium]